MANRSPVLAAMIAAGAELTLDNWLEWNLMDPNDPPDAELLDLRARNGGIRCGIMARSLTHVPENRWADVEWFDEE